MNSIHYLLITTVALTISAGAAFAETNTPNNGSHFPTQKDVQKVHEKIQEKGENFFDDSKREERQKKWDERREELRKAREERMNQLKQ